MNKLTSDLLKEESDKPNSLSLQQMNTEFAHI